MKRFFIILIATILVISSFFLILSIFQLYKDAEKGAEEYFNTRNCFSRVRCD